MVRTPPQRRERDNRSRALIGSSSEEEASEEEPHCFDAGVRTFSWSVLRRVRSTRQVYGFRVYGFEVRNLGQRLKGWGFAVDD